MARSATAAATAAVAAVTAAVLAATQAHAAKDDTLLVTPPGAGAPNPELTYDSGSTSPSLSADGRWIAFSSDVDSLTDEDDNVSAQIFLRDAQSGTTILVSRQSAGAGGAASDGGCSSPAVSDDGRYVAFESAARNLSDADANGNDNDDATDVYLRDVRTNTTTLVSRQSASAGGAGGDQWSSSPSISADGRLVAFNSYATNLSNADEDLNEYADPDDYADGGYVSVDDLVSDVFIRDTRSDTTTLVSRQSASGGGKGGDGNSSAASVSADGRFAAFESEASNLAGGSENSGAGHVFLRDTGNNTTTLVSRQSDADGGAAADGYSFLPSVSGDGRYVAFTSRAPNLSPDDDPNGIEVADVFLRDTRAGTTALLSRQGGDAGAAGADGESFGAPVSDDGRYVAFSSLAPNLSDADPSGELEMSDVFVRDIEASTTTLVSRQTGAAGTAGDDASFVPAVSADGRFVAFASGADNLSDTDDNAVSNVFLRDVLGPPVDPGGGGPGIVTPPPPSGFAIHTLRRTARGELVVTVKVPARGWLAVHATAKTPPTARGRARKKITVARALRSVPVPSQIKVTLKPSRPARKALAKGRKLRARVKVTYAPAGGARSSLSKTITLRITRNR